MRYRKTKKGVEYVTVEDIKREVLRSPRLKKVYDALQPKYDLIRVILDARIKRGITQAELARRIGTTQSAIARFESGEGNPTLDFLAKVSTAIGGRLELRISR